MQMLQRHHIEVSTILLSGLRLCAVLDSGSGAKGNNNSNLVCFIALALVHLLALLLECGSTLGSPYRLRRSASHGIAQGVLAVPSVLAALVATAPADGWQPWLLGSCSAAVAILAVICLQSASAVSRKQQATSKHSSSIPEPTKRCGWLSGPALPSSLAVAACVCVLAIASKQQQFVWQGRLELQLQGLAGLLAGAEQHATLLQLAAVWACVAAASFCLSLQLLPGCFSLGEAALLAQGATCLAVTAAGALQHAWLFVPAVVCSQLPQAVLAPVQQQLGGCTAAAHRAALSLPSLLAAITLVLAAAVGACLLLRVLHVALLQLQQQRPSGSSCSSSGRNGSAPINGHAAAPKRPPGGAAGAAEQCGAASGSNSSGGPLRAAIVVSSAAVALAAAAGICLLLTWLCCAAAWTLLEFLPAEPGRVGVLLYWLGVLAATLPALKWLARVGSMPQIIVRKVYHLLAMGLFVPVFFWDLQLLALSLAIAFAALVLLEVLRCMRLPLLGQAVQDFMQEFVDERDAGVIYITHFTLLLGLAVPMWLCLVMPGAHVLLDAHPLAHPHFISSSSSSCPSGGIGSISSTGCSSLLTEASGSAGAASAAGVSSRLWAALAVLLGLSSHGTAAAGWSDAGAALLQVTAGLSGLVIIGVGDTAASFVGKLFGRVPVHAGSSKTVEGTVAGISASLGAWVLLLWAVRLLPAWSWSSWSWWGQLAAATAGAGLMEAATSQLDNILLPLWYLPHLVVVASA